MSFGDPTRDRQSKAGAATCVVELEIVRAQAHRVRAIESFKDVPLRFRRNPDASICDREQILRTVTRGADMHAAALLSVLDGVVEQVDDHPSNQCLVAAERKFA